MFCVILTKQIMNPQATQLSTEKALVFQPSVYVHLCRMFPLCCAFTSLLQPKPSQLLASLLWWPFHSLMYPSVRKLPHNFDLVVFLQHSSFMIRHRALCCLLSAQHSHPADSRALSPCASVLRAQSECAISNWALFPH